MQTIKKILSTMFEIMAESRAQAVKARYFRYLNR
jgi:hypothetical protein